MPNRRQFMGTAAGTASMAAMPPLVNISTQPPGNAFSVTLESNEETPPTQDQIDGMAPYCARDIEEVVVQAGDIEAAIVKARKHFPGFTVVSAHRHHQRFIT